MDPLTIFHKRTKQYESKFRIRLYMSINPSLTMQMVLEDIKQNPSQKNEWTFYNMCTVIPVKELLANGFQPENNNLYHRSDIINIDIDTLVQLKNHRWYWRYLSVNKHITLEDIAAHPELPWDYSVMSRFNPNKKLVPLLLTHRDENTYRILGYGATYEQIITEPDKPWDEGCLGSPNITNKEHLKELWNKFSTARVHTSSHYLAKNPALTFSDLEELLPPSILRYHASWNPNLTPEDFLKYKDKSDWDFDTLSKMLPVEFILKHSNYEWSWISMLYDNRTLSYEILQNKTLQSHVKRHYYKYGQALSDKEIYGKMLGFVFSNRSFPQYDRKKVFEELLFDYYLKDDRLTPDFLIHSALFLEPTFEEIRNYFAGKRIIRHIVETVSNPEYEQCRKRLKREHETLV